MLSVRRNPVTSHKGWYRPRWNYSPVPFWISSCSCSRPDTCRWVLWNWSCWFLILRVPDGVRPSVQRRPQRPNRVWDSGGYSGIMEKPIAGLPIRDLKDVLYLLDSLLSIFITDPIHIDQSHLKLPFTDSSSSLAAVP